MQSSSARIPAAYRPWLDGVRAVACAMVIVQHAVGWEKISPGGSGVGLFFALSGYLITGLLLDERSRSGRISLMRFYVRRAARLAPALCLMLAATSALLLAMGGQAARLAVGAIPSLFYVTNYYALAHGDFPAVFGPTWSLAVEEHFYLIWPCALAFLIRRRWSVQRLLTLTLAVCLAALALRFLEVRVIGNVPMELPYIGSPERADALLY